jgi:hypothetical protein
VRVLYSRVYTRCGPHRFCFPCRSHVYENNTSSALRRTLFWDVSTLVVGYRRFGIVYWPHLEGASSLTLEGGTVTFYRNVGNQLLTSASQQLRRARACTARQRRPETSRSDAAFVTVCCNSAVRNVLPLERFRLSLQQNEEINGNCRRPVDVFRVLLTPYTLP